MTTYYALPRLTSLSESGGYSLTSGGAVTSRVPQYNDDEIIFDANSGSSRQISGDIEIANIKMQNSQFMRFTGRLTLHGSPYSNYLNGTVSELYLDAPGGIIGGSTSSSIGYLWVGSTIGYGNNPTGWTMTSNLTVTEGVEIISDASHGSASLNMAGYTLTAASLGMRGGYKPEESFARLRGSGGTLVITGAKGRNTNPVILVPSYGTIDMASGYIKFTDKSSAVKVVSYEGNNREVGTQYLGNIVNDTGNESGTGGLQFTAYGNHLFNSYDCGKGAVNIFPANYNVYANDWIMNGDGLVTAIRSSTAGARTKLRMMSAGTPIAGTISANFCSFKDVTTQGAEAPTSKIKALNSVDLGNNAGIEYVKPTSHFFAFF